MTAKKIWFPKGELKDGLTGALEIACFLKQGVNRFQNTPEAAMRSFWILLSSYALNISAMILIHDQFKEERPLPPPEMLILYDAQRFMVVQALFILALYGLCKWWDRKSDFPRVLGGQNWLQVIPLAILSPLHLMVWAGWHDVEVAAMLEFPFLVYFVAMSAFFISRAAKIPVFVTAYLAIMAYMVDQVSLMIMLN